MLILAAKKSKPTPCCGCCAEGKPCADKKFVASPSGLLLPDRRIVEPRSMLYGTTGELEGVRASWNRPLLMPTFDMSCLPCCQGGDGDTTCVCTCTEYTVTIAGITGPGSCTAVNGTYLAPNTSPLVTWQSAGTPAFVVQCNPGSYPGYYTATFQGTFGAATYKLLMPSWSCFGCNTLDFVLAVGACAGWPATVEVCCTD